MERINSTRSNFLNTAALDGFTSVAADIGQNFRDVLDKTVYTIALAVNHPRPWQVTFPFATVSGDLENQIKGRLNGLPTELHSLVRSFNPYKGGNVSLWALNEIANAKKHRVTVEIGISGKPSISNLRLKTKGSGVRIGAPVWNRAKQEMIVLTIFGGEGDVDYGDMKFTFFITFDELEFVGGQPAIAVLNDMGREVERVLLAIEDKSRSLGLIP